MQHRAGPLTVDYVKLAMASDARLNVVVYLPADAETAARLPSLA